MLPNRLGSPHNAYILLCGQETKFVKHMFCLIVVRTGVAKISALQYSSSYNRLLIVRFLHDLGSALVHTEQSGFSDVVVFHKSSRVCLMLSSLYSISLCFTCFLHSKSK